MIAAALCVVAWSADAKDVEKTAKSGEATYISIYRSWKRDCSSNDGVVKLVDKPLNGTLKTSQVDSVIVLSRYDPEKTKHCVGQPIKGFRIDYTSNPGFRGVDRFKVEVTFGKRRPEIDTFRVTVQ